MRLNGWLVSTKGVIITESVPALLVSAEKHLPSKISIQKFLSSLYNIYLLPDYNSFTIFTF